MEREREKEDGRLGDPSRLGIKTPDETQAQGWGPNCKQDLYSVLSTLLSFVLCPFT